MVNADPTYSKYVGLTPVFECQTPPDAEDVIDTITYCVSFCDNGDENALAAVQSQYPNQVVSRTDRAGSISTYQLEKLAADSAPASVLVTLPVRLAICDVCPSTYTLLNEQTQYIIETPLDGSEDLNSSADQQTFANTIKALYVVPKTFNGASAVDPTTNQITITAHGLSDDEAVVYSNGGGTTIVGLTNGATYYVNVVDANNVTLSATPGGAVVDITADGVGAAHTLTVQSTAVFLENTGGSAKILINVDALNPELTPVLADIVTLVGENEALCLPPAGTSTAWTACGTGFKVERTLSLTITDDCASDLASVQEQYPSYTVTLAESGNCNSRYELVQVSETVQTDCEFTAPLVFTDIQPYKGIEWTVVEPTLTGADCVAGVKIEGKPLDKYGNPCDPVAFPYEFDKLTFEVFAYKGAPTSQDFITFDRCDNIPITTTQRSTFVTGSGDEIFELEKRYHSYQTTGVAKHIYHNSTWNGGFIRYSDKTKFYDTYVLKFKSPDLNTWSENSRQDESIIIAVPTGTGQALEQFLIGYFGVEKFTAGVLSN
jgi:hypothetical protein